MRRSATRAPEWRTNMNALLLIGSIRCSATLEHYRSLVVQRPGVFQALVRLPIELAHEESLLKLRDRTWRVFPEDSDHRIAEVVCAVKPSPIRPVPKKQVVNEPAVIAMPKDVDNILTVGHKEHVVACPTEICATGWHGLKLIELCTNLFVGDRRCSEAPQCR
jgi:hypothetical protein